ncbi:MAG: hypothetical protein KDA84_09480 [Planctomycetaceae bacterium]|nr:hypothetical protein [Planctomycetaceae bacterium]
MQTKPDLKRKPNSLFRRTEFHVGVAVCLLVVVGIIVWLVMGNVTRGTRRELNSKWKFADQTFRQTQFENARQAYEDIGAFCKDQQLTGSESELAGIMQEIVQTCRKIEQAATAQ